MKLCDYGVVCGGRGREGSVCPDAPAEADVLLVNTCAVRDHAEQRVLGRMGELKRYKRPGDVLGVVGGTPQRLGPRLLERVPQGDLIIGPDGYRSHAPPDAQHIARAESGRAHARNPSTALRRVP